MCDLGVGASLVQLASALAVIDGDVTFLLVTVPFFSCFPPSTSSDRYCRCRYPDSLNFYIKNVDTSGFRRWAVELLNYGKSAKEMENGWTTFAQRDSASGSAFKKHVKPIIPDRYSQLPFTVTTRLVSNIITYLLLLGYDGFC